MGPDSSPNGHRRQRRLAGTRQIIQISSIIAICIGCVVSAHAQFAVDRLALHQFEDGPILEPTHIFLPGEAVFFSCRLTGFKIAEGGDEKRSVKLSWQVHATDPSGVPVAKDASGRIEEPVFAQDKNWVPRFLYNFVVPPFAPSGIYHIAIQAKDEVSGMELKSQLNFTVRGQNVEPSDTLVIRNLRFLRGEEDKGPLNPAVYHPGEMLWARFEITGYKFGEKNRYSVDYGLAILRESGDQVFAQPGAATDSHESFYPQHFVPGEVSLNLNNGVVPGNYILVITTSDKIGNQTAEARGMFRVER